MNTQSTTAGPDRNASDVGLRAIPQFDAGRWKLRLEKITTSTAQQLESVSTIAVGFTMLSPLLFLVTTYLWARLKS
jgi:hypothetical protein